MASLCREFRIPGKRATAATGPPPQALGPSNYAGPPNPSSPVIAGPAIQTSVVSGTVRNAVDGQVNGLILSDGTAVYFPPELGNQVTSMVAIRTRVTVAGLLRIGPAGNRLVDAQIITNRRTGATVTVYNPPPPSP